MIGNIKVLWAMFYHFLRRGSVRRKYYIGEEAVSQEVKREHRTKLYECMRELSTNMLKAAGTEIVITGKENLPKEGPVVYIANHKSLLDSPLMAYLVEEPIIFIGKAETKKMPIVGKWFDAMGCIYIDRDDMRQQLQAITKGINELKNGQSVVIFPEGKRSKERKMGEFKAGSFKLATKAKVPIVPIAFQDTFKILEETGSIQKAVIRVNVGKTIDVPNMTQEELKTLPQDVEAYIRQLLVEITEN